MSDHLADYSSMACEVRAMRRELDAAHQRAARARRAVRRAAVVVGVAVASLTGTAFSADFCRPAGLLYCFSGGEPARASQINENFATLANGLADQSQAQAEFMSKVEAQLSTAEQDVTTRNLRAAGDAEVDGTLTLSSDLVTRDGTHLSGFRLVVRTATADLGVGGELYDRTTSVSTDVPTGQGACFLSRTRAFLGQTSSFTNGDERFNHECRIVDSGGKWVVQASVGYMRHSAVRAQQVCEATCLVWAN